VSDSARYNWPSSSSSAPRRVSRFISRAMTVCSSSCSTSSVGAGRPVVGPGRRARGLGPDRRARSADGGVADDRHRNRDVVAHKRCSPGGGCALCPASGPSTGSRAGSRPAAARRPAAFTPGCVRKGAYASCSPLPMALATRAGPCEGV
jgi:hypothetical protein